MKITKTFLVVVVAMAFAVSLTVIATTKKGEKTLVSFGYDFKVSSKEAQSSVSTKRTSRILAQADPRPKFHCNKDNEICHEKGSLGSVCCNNKCIDIKTDNKNRGACKNKCKYIETCCDGQCVNVNFDKRHCGECGNKCIQGGYCIYGMCDYA